MTVAGVVLFIIGALGAAMLFGLIPMGSLPITEAQGFLLIVACIWALIIGPILIAVGVFVR